MACKVVMDCSELPNYEANDLELNSELKVPNDKPVPTSRAEIHLLGLRPPRRQLYSILMQSHRILPIIAWAFLAFIVFATLLPFSLRPVLTETEPFLVVVLERVGAFGVLGLLFFTSYPERPRTVGLAVFGSAAALELAQAFLPDRHTEFVDALEKIVGGGAGIMLGVALRPVLTSPDGLFSRINQQWLGPKAVDSETRELMIGLFAIALFALALVAFANFRPLNY